jgi:hypothetical protein
VDADENLAEVDQQPGLDAPYGNQPAAQQPAPTADHPRSQPTGQGAF